MSKHTFTFDPHGKGLRKVFGDLESDIMEVVWEYKSVTVRDVHRHLNKKRPLAYTTVMTVMTRLAEKGVLRKIKSGSAFVYQPVRSRASFTLRASLQIFKSLLDDFSKPVMSELIDTIYRENPERLEELSALIEQKKKKK